MAVPKDTGTCRIGEAIMILESWSGATARGRGFCAAENGALFGEEKEKERRRKGLKLNCTQLRIELVYFRFKWFKAS